MSSGKEAIVFVLDVGPGCWQTESPLPNKANTDATSNATTTENTITLLDKAIQCVVTMLNHKIMEGRKTDSAGIILMNSNDTTNPLFNPETAAEEADDEDTPQYTNIAVVQPLATPSYGMVRFLKEQIQLGQSTRSDPVDALVVAADALIELTKGKAYASKRIILFTDAYTVGQPASLEDGSDECLGQIAGQINDAAISVDVIRLRSEEAKRSGGMFDAWEAGFGRFCEDRLSDAGVYEIDEALEVLSHFASRKVRQSAIFRGTLDIGVGLGESEKTGGGSAAGAGLSIPICLYGKTTMAKLPVAKKLKGDNAAPVERSLAYITANQEEGGADAGRIVDKEDLIKAYRYGRTLVPFHRIDQEQMAYKTVRGMCLLGFQSAAKLDRHLFMTGVWMMVGDMAGKGEGGNCAAAVDALTALVHAAYEKGVVGVARYVRAASSPPRMVVLIPHIKRDYSGFLVCGMPFAEDQRRFYFSPLFQPSRKGNGGLAQVSEDQASLMRQWIQASTTEMDVDLFKPRTVYNPTYQRLFQCITHRVAHPDDPLPACEPAILASVSPFGKESAEFTALKAAFPLTPRQANPKHRGVGKIMRFWTDYSVVVPEETAAAAEDAGAETPLPLKKPDEFEPKPVRRTIRADHAIADFTEMATNRFHDLVEPAMTQMMQLIPRLAVQLDLAIECFRVLRDTAIKEDEFVRLNMYLQELKRLRYEDPERFPSMLWDRLAAERVWPISKAEHPSSMISPEHASEVCKDFVPYVM